jgi:NTE family protein
VYAEWRDLTIYNAQEKADAVLNIDQWGANFAIQREFANRASLWGGVRLYDGSITADVGTIPSGTGSFKGGEYAAGFDYDTLDDRYYPSSGVWARAQYLNADDSLGSDAVYDQSIQTVLAANTWGRHTFIGNLRYSTTLSGRAPYWVRFRSGGLFDLSGLQPEQISGDHYGFGMAGWRYALRSGRPFFPAHVGLSVEYGNATDEREDIIDEGIAAGSLYFAYRSPIGPLYWGVGFAEGGQRAYFLRIGNIFGRSSITR